MICAVQNGIIQMGPWTGRAPGDIGSIDSVESNGIVTSATNHKDRNNGRLSTWEIRKCRLSVISSRQLNGKQRDSHSPPYPVSQGVHSPHNVRIRGMPHWDLPWRPLQKPLPVYLRPRGMRGWLRTSINFAWDSDIVENAFGLLRSMRRTFSRLPFSLLKRSRQCGQPPHRYRPT